MKWCGRNSYLDPLDIIGEKFGQIEVIKYEGQALSHYKKSCMDYFYLCGCSCGKQWVTKRRALIGQSIKSCGHLGWGKWGNHNARYRLIPTYPNLKRLYMGYKKHAEIRNLTWDLNIHEFHVLTKRSCHYCGKPPMQIRRHSRNEPKTKWYYYNGLDRKDNKKAYIRENVVPCCFECNHAKMGLSENQFLNLAGCIYCYQNRNKILEVRL